jgi:hypothetical protein
LLSTDVIDFFFRFIHLGFLSLQFFVSCQEVSKHYFFQVLFSCNLSFSPSRTLMTWICNLFVILHFFSNSFSLCCSIWIISFFCYMFHSFFLYPFHSAAESFHWDFYFNFGGARTGTWTQCFVLAKQALYHLSHTSSTFCSDYFCRLGLANYLPMAGLELWSLQVLRLQVWAQAPVYFNYCIFEF